MPNEVKYANQEWGDDTPIAGERLSTNGFYTGEQKGAVLQDEAVDGTEEPYERELNMIRFGTIMQDAVEGSMPEKE